MELGIPQTQYYSKVSNIDFTAEVQKKNRFFDPNKFNTPIPAERKIEFEEWKKTNVPLKDSGIDYDYAGTFMAGFSRETSENGHLPDTFKKPNHPTFSIESKYAKGSYKKFAGKWNGENFIPSKIIYNKIKEN